MEWINNPIEITSYNLLELINGHKCTGNLTVNEWWMDGQRLYLKSSKVNIANDQKCIVVPLALMDYSCYLPKK